ncbi:hypothetical protein CY35_05G088400 [Sphagnum magellanicum]|jgi:uncharacterized protein (TIGR01569 family)|nr:hypothetical protein CY35_05G088400 [Sphagnum magellanicum]
MKNNNGHEANEGNVGLDMKTDDHDSGRRRSLMQAAAAPSKVVNISLRLAAIALSVAGLVVMDTDEQLGSTPFYLPYLNTDINVPKKAYYSLFTSFKYLVWANAVAAVVALVQLIIVAAISRQSKAGSWITLLADQAVAYVLLAAAASSTEVAYVAEHGINYIGWNEQCSNYHSFCTRVGISLILTYMATLVFATLAIISAHRLFSLQSVHVQS